MSEAAAPFNPFTGKRRDKLRLIAQLLAARRRVSTADASVALGRCCDGREVNYVAQLITAIRAQLPAGIAVLCQRGVGYHVSDKAKLAAFLRGENAQ
ncbi:hypothetical protein DYI24_20885 [Rhodopseudomonas sp. BR0C11]|uniref:hypothetical protein n=1 Tax=Rhodopseudomonas sp. BR0C11 TaxID=2269370 RepID=UPI0013DEF0FA|nr:hypothetical protein [Rhodopseudomonas sp. BR0C11]NEV79495.1 hypothetical protein [Rhodopseudomonas sp. BR0C11]